MIPIEVIAGKIIHELPAIEAEYQVLKAGAIARLRNVDGQLQLLDGDLSDGSHEAFPAGELPTEPPQVSSPPAEPVDPNAGPVPPVGSSAGGDDVTPPTTEPETLEGDLEGLAAALKAAGIESVEQLAAALAAKGEPVAVPDPGAGDQSGEAPAATGGGDTSATAPSTPEAAQDPAAAPPTAEVTDPPTSAADDAQSATPPQAAAAATPPDGSIDASATDTPSTGTGDVG